MIPKYLATLAVAVVVITFAASLLPFATRSQVLSGHAVNEALRLEFTIAADSGDYYIIKPAIAEFLQSHIRFRTAGPPRVIAANVEVTPQDVSWSENRRTMTAAGAAMSAQLEWDTPSDSANGAYGFIYLDFPEIPGLNRKEPSFHSGAYQKDRAGRRVIREVTTYRSSFRLSLARFAAALPAGLPYGILLHTIYWAFVLKREKRSRVAALPPEGAGLPRTFYPDPIEEWTSWLIVLGVGAGASAMMAGMAVWEGFVSSFLAPFIYTFLAVAVAIALALAYFSGKNVLTIRVASDGISYVRGRDNLQWLNAAWSDIVWKLKSSQYRSGTRYRIELEFKDKRKKLKIDQSHKAYPTLRKLLS